jgi:hypothetical protein
MHLCTTVGQGGFTTVSFTFDATKFPFQIRAGYPENNVSFAGKNPSVFRRLI